jgi:type I restriction enzyme S subunit
MDNFIVSCKDKQLLKYVYYYLKSNKKIINNGLKGATIKHVSKDYINNIEIPIPNEIIQKEINIFCDDTNILINNIFTEISKTKNLIHNILDFSNYN